MRLSLINTMDVKISFTLTSVSFKCSINVVQAAHTVAAMFPTPGSCSSWRYVVGITSTNHWVLCHCLTSVEANEITRFSVPRTVGGHSNRNVQLVFKNNNNTFLQAVFKKERKWVNKYFFVGKLPEIFNLIVLILITLTNLVNIILVL